MGDYRSENSDKRSAPGEFRLDTPAVGGQRSPIDELLSALSHRRRRDVLYALSENEVTDVDSLATTIAAREADLPPEQIDDDEREPVLIDLYHNHLPKLADHNLVEYDSRSGAVRWTPLSDDLEQILECCHALEMDTE
ncbi:hypothetical protein CV102_24915 [Natronococcus pandeyae]|uniref:DUF7344 domain-containing protein n=1 Tax=Natronococcus pandeyae TaxID=2055836 RepID=A0A8J8PW72_9EURY|nr:hypothetical protein [Natronococcus pandeyae]TYL35996.1 hypothetical protein CV102_24915 [Natronococcus pandeyae]